MGDERVEAAINGKKRITFDVPIAVLGGAIFLSIGWVYCQVRDVEVEVNKHGEDLAAVKADMNAMKESNKSLKDDLDKLAPRTFTPPVREPPPYRPAPLLMPDGGP